MASPKEVFRNFCMTCTIKGLPKILKSETVSLKILWWFGFAFGVVIGLYQTVVIVTAYFAYHTKTVVSVEESAIHTFPDITVCKINPSTIVGEEGNQTFENYMSRVTKVIEEEENEDTRSMLDGIKGIFGYYRNIEIINTSVKANLKDFVVYCKVLDATKSKKCAPEDYVFLTPAYPSCVTFTKNMEIETWSAVFYLNDFEPVPDTKFFKYPKAKYYSGVALFLHDAHVHPLSQIFYVIGPGKESFFSLEEIMMENVPYPYSDCYDGKSMDANGNTIQYAFENCAYDCIQIETRSRCGCLDPDIPAFRPAGNVKYCGYLFDNASLTAAQIKCWETHVVQIDKACRSKCKNACSTRHYDIVTATVPWPHASRHVAFYNTFIKGNPVYGDRFDLYENISMEMAIDRLSAYEKVRSTDLLERNFLKVTINMLETSWRYDKIPDMSLSLVSGSLGGILNLWIGVTFITAVEVLELLIRLIKLKAE